VRLPAIASSALLGALLVGPASAETVLVLGSDVPAEVTDAGIALVDTGLFVAGDVTELAGSATPLLADLTPHDIVLVFAFATPWDDADALGDVLADAVDAGVEVVLAGSLVAPFAPAGRFAADLYSPVDGSTAAPIPGDVDFASPTTIATHPSLLGLTTIGYPDLGQGALLLGTSGTAFATDTAGGFVGADVCDRSVVAMSLHPPDMGLGGPATEDARLWFGQGVLSTQTTAPTADAGGAFSVPEGGSAALDGSGSAPGDFGPLIYAWDLDGDGAFDDATGAAPTFSAASLDGPTSVTLGLEVTDACGRTATDAAVVTVTNAAPEITSTTQNGPVQETGTVDFTAAATDPGGDSVAFTWDFDDGSPTVAGASPSHAYADDGTYSVSVLADDGEGGTDSASVTVTVTNVAPVLASVTGNTSVIVGETAALVGVASDLAGAADPLTWTWDWGDSSADDVGVGLSSASHAYASPGTFGVSVTVSDGDGGSDSIDFDIVVSNPGPSISLVSSPGALNEAASGSFVVSAADILGGAVTVSWDWGDASALEVGFDLEANTHTYADDGTFDATVTATDAFGASVALSIATPVANLAPSITSNPGTVAVEGTPYTAALSAADVPADLPDLLWLPQSAPAGATFDAGAATFAWAPTLSEALGGSADFSVLVSDGDGGTDELSWTVLVDYEDLDNDGMADSWEVEHGLNPSLDDSLGDPDLDALSNLDEWLAGTDPQVFGGPSGPQAIFPLEGESVASAQPALTVSNAVDPDGDALSYAFEIYADVTLTTLVEAEAGVAEGGAETSWAPGGALSENTGYVWRARAADPRVSGAWTDVEAFFVDEANDPPDVPTPLSPDATTVDLPLPGFVVAVGSDPEGDAFVVEIELVDETAGAFVGVHGDGFADDGTWLATPATSLEEDHEFSWRARTVDVRGGASDWSAAAAFEVDVSNTPPPSPTVVSPPDGSEIGTTLPALVVAAGADPDGDPITVVFGVDVDPAFASGAREDLGPVEVLAGEATATVQSELPENRVVFARARAEDDRGGASEWVVWSFFVDALDEAPDGPRILAPEDTSVVGGDAVEVRWGPAIDPEGDALVYALAIASDPRGEVLWTVAGLTIPDGDIEGSATVDIDVPPGAWTVAARATDVGGEVGPEGPPSRFVVLPPTGSTADLDVGDGPYGCDCTSSVVATPGGSGGGLLLLVGWVVGRRRRRRG